MIPFHKIYTWLFRSFRIDSETSMVQGLINEGVKSIIIIKRSWIYALFLSWIPIVLFFLTLLNIYILSESYDDEVILRMTMIVIMIANMGFYFIMGILFVKHFREVHMNNATIWSNMKQLLENLNRSDQYFINFFNQSIFVQLVVIGIIIFDVYRIMFYHDRTMLFAAIDIVNLVFIWLLLRYHRKRLMDMEMDFNIAIPGKIYFANQTGILSSMYSIESDKIKSIRASYTSGFASFFRYGKIDILTEGDTQYDMGKMSLHYVTEPDAAVAAIQKMMIPTQQQKSKKKKQQSSENSHFATYHNAPNVQIKVKEKVAEIS